LTLFGSKNVLLADQIVSEEYRRRKNVSISELLRVATDILIKTLSDVRMITLH